MEPVDFDPATTNLQDVEDLRRRRNSLDALLRWTVLALLAWGLLAVLMLMLERFHMGAPLLDLSSLLMDLLAPEFLAPMRELATMTADTLYWPIIAVVVLLLLRGLLGEFLLRRMFGRRKEVSTEDLLSQMQPGQQPRLGSHGHRRITTVVLDALRFGPMLMAGLALIWAVMASYALLGGDDPWEGLPWVTPPYLSEFLSRHPDLQADRGSQTSGQLTLRDRDGHAISLYGSELAGGQIRFQPCPPALGNASLGGIPPYPGIPCTTQVNLRNAQGEHQIHVFKIADGSDTEAIHAHFRRWADEHSGSSASSTTQGGRHSFSAGSRDGAWHLDLESYPGGATTIVIRRKPQPS